MRKTIMLAALLMGVMGSPSTRSFAQPAQVPPRCLHGPSEQPNQRTRREQALKMAEDINRAEHTGPKLVSGENRYGLGQIRKCPGGPQIGRRRGAAKRSEDPEREKRGSVKKRAAKLQ